ncbi:MAG: LPXTG cell wall anchor domain-containing protein, partial [Microbacterium chocolatum]|nr:LPXTG cell wall anchor domain-containing protein [Microbacterium chocolatum]
WAVIPAGTATGAHTLVVQTADGVLGWAGLEVLPAAGEAPIDPVDPPVTGAPANSGNAAGPGTLPATGTDGLVLGLAAGGALLLLALGAVLVIRRRAA